MVKARADANQVLGEIPGAISLHNFHYDKAHNYFRFDVIVDFSVRDFSAFQKQLTAALQHKYPGAGAEINVDLDYCSTQAGVPLKACATAEWQCLFG
ncbi:MAG: hypothetical protein AB7V55_07970 [Oscillospiraceae bacterium]